jgi:hypothetical protein
VRRISNLATLFISTIILLACAITCVAQNREKFVISAKAGGINAITGQASIHGKGESDWQQLMITDDLQAGDRVRTDSDGRVEILLNPGSYLRVGGDSEVELSDNSLANLEVRLLRGTAVVEATGVEEAQMLINISTPHARLAIDRQGLYRLNVIPNDATVLIVRKGRVILGESHTKIKGGNKVVFSATAVSVAKLTDDEKKQEKEVAIERWSQERAETLAKANSRINNRMLTSAFSAANSSDLFFLGRFRGSGLWFYNSRMACFTFLPYGYYGFSSPYGVSYQTTVYGGSHGSGYGYGSGSRSGNIVPILTNGSPISTGSSSPSASMPVRTTPMSSAPSGNDIEGGRTTRGRNLDAGRP